MRHRITAFGVACAFLVCCVLWCVVMVWVMVALAGSDDNQCDYEPPPEFLWEGELNPNAFDNWEILSVQRTLNPLFILTFISNPDKTSAIKKVAVTIMAFDGGLLEYQYFKDGRPYSYVFDGEDKYVERKFTPEERKGCMECHQDQIVAGEAI